MKRRFILILLFFLSVLLFPFCFAATVTVDQNTQYQTILGWGNAGLPSGMGLTTNGNQFVPIPLYMQLLDDAVDNFGFTSTYAWPQALGTWEPYNDNVDPYVTNWSAFNTAGADEAGRLAVEMKQRVEANGDPFLLMVRASYGAGYLGWLTESPGEYTEGAITFMTYLKNTYGLDVNYWIIVNEPSSVFPASPTQIATTMKTLFPTMQANGFITKIMYPESANTILSWNYITPLQNDPEIWNYIGLITWHLYSSNPEPERTQIYNFAKQKGIPTGQTETAAAPITSLYDDLVQGGISYWTPGFAFIGIGTNNAASGTPYLVSPSLTTFSRSQQFYQLRQVTKYARPGSVRIRATSDDNRLLTLAFTKNGKVSVVLINNGTSSISTTVNSLPSGLYGVSQATGANSYVELGTRSVSGSTTINVPASTTLTIYPYVGINQAPVLTDWRSTPEYLKIPASTATLKVNATDAELDPLSYSWSVKIKPTGSNPTFTNPSSASTTVNGLTVGNYTFTVTVSDPTHSVSRDVFLNVYNGNQPPFASELFIIGGERHFVGKMLIINIVGKDLEGDTITYDTTLIGKPAGSNAVITNPSLSRQQLLADQPGVYTFRVETRDSFGMRSDIVSANVVVGGQSAPIINSATATQIGQGQAQLNTAATDPDGEPLTYWWNLKSGPANVKPFFQTPGSLSTSVTNLTNGNYVFTVTAIDQRNFTKRDVLVTISSSGNPPVCGNNIVESGEQCDTGGSRGTCPATCSLNCIVNVCTPPPTPVNLLIAYDFNENGGTTTADSSGNSRTGTLTGTTWVPGKTGSGLNFNPSSSSKIVAIDFAPPQNITMEAWIYPTDTNDDRIVISKSLVEYEMRILGGTSTRLQAGLGNARLRDNGLDFSNPTNLNQWYHYAYTYDSLTDEAKLYRNGNLVNSSTFSNPNVVDSVDPLHIGRAPSGFGTFGGIIDDVRIWSVVRTQSEIQTDMGGGTPCVDTSWNPSEINLCGSVSQVSNCGNTRIFAGGVQCTTSQTCTNNACVNSPTNNTTIPPVIPPSTGGGGGGSSGGSGRTSRTPVITQTKGLNQAIPGIVNILRDFNPDTGLKHIELRVIGATQNVGVTVSQYENLPEAVSVKKPGKIYKYLRIEPQNLSNNLESAIIKSQVEKSWIQENHLSKDDIALFKFNELSKEWNELPTIFMEEDLIYYYYETEIQSFSYFLIGQKATPLDVFGAKLLIALLIMFLVLTTIVYLLLMKYRRIKTQHQHIGPTPAIPSG